MAPIALSDSKLHETEFKATTYKRGLATVEDQLVTFRKNEILFSEEITVLKREVVPQRARQVVGVKITDKSKKGLGYHVVPPPHPLIYNAPPKLDLSNSGLEEFQQPEFKGYRPKDSKNVSTGAPIIKDWNLTIEFVRPKQQEKLVRKPVKYAEMYRQVNTARPKAVVNAVRTNQVNAVKASTCWVWRPRKIQVCIGLGSQAVKLHDQFDDEKRAGAELTQQNDKSQYKKLHGKLMLIEKITSEVNAD
ncbi:hypothetical protein Tco_0092131 [Tanacetum coccineum]